MNKDSYARTHWPEAYTQALVTVADTVLTVKGWINSLDPTMWQRMMAYRLIDPVDQAALTEALKASLHVSESVTVPFQSRKASEIDGRCQLEKAAAAAAALQCDSASLA